MPSPLPSGLDGGGDLAAKSDAKLTLNVSGRHYEAWMQTIERFPDTLLGSAEREYFRDSDTGEYFFDRDPELFRYILNYYRTGRIHLPRDVCLTAFVDELAFFGIRTDVISDCCHEDFEDRWCPITLVNTRMIQCQLTCNSTHFELLEAQLSVKKTFLFVSPRLFFCLFLC